MVLLIVRIRSLDVSGIAEDDGSCVAVHFRNICFGRGSFLHTSQALRPEKRGSPLPMGRTGMDFITLTLHCVRARPAGKEVRLRLDLFDARFFLSGSVVHFVTGTSSEDERRRETVTADVPFPSTPSFPDSQRRIATLTLRSLLCRAYTLQGLQFLRYGCWISAESAEPVISLVILSCYNHSASTPSLKPLPPARLARPKCVATSP